MTIQQAFEMALQHHQAGQLAEAETIYRQILAAEPRHAATLNLLGVLAHQVGRHDVAVEHLRQAIALAPGVPAFYSNLGEAYRVQGCLEDAVAAFRQAIALQPDYSEAHYNLGVALQAKGQPEKAIAAYRQAIALQPNLPEAHNNLGNALKDQGCLDEAIAAYRQAIALQPDFASAHCNLGNALWEKGQLEEAIAACRQAIALQPDFPEAFMNLGNPLHNQGRVAEAIAAFRQAIALQPNYPEAYNNLGVALKDRGQLEEAIAACRQALALNPNYAEAHVNLGNAFKDAERLDEAIAAYRRAIQLQPDYAAAHNNLGTALKDVGQVDDAVTCYRRAMTIAPQDSDFHSNLIYTLHFHPGFDARAIAEEHRRWNQQHAEGLRPFIQPHLNDRNPKRRLRIGYVSPDFCSQAESFFVVPLLEAHDHSQYEIHAYASVARPDQVTGRMRRSASAWHDVLGLGNVELAEKIRQDRIDILVDLTMHMARNRLPLFARKPAPVQATWLAYPGSTGLETIDYRITDFHMDPPFLGTEGYSEESVRLPDSWCCYDPMSDLAPSPVETAHWGSYVRFGSLNNCCKLNEPLLRLWAQLLMKVGGSRLLLMVDAGTHREAFRKTLAAMGVHGDRVEFTGKCSRQDYLRLYDGIDIALDPLPYNGITTTLDALWMGVPVVSLAGKTAAGRAGLSLLTTTGLPQLAMQTPEDFVQVAAGLAQDLPRLAGLRSTLREKMKASPLMDAPRFARNVEQAYRHMWRTWCAGQSARLA